MSSFKCKDIGMKDGFEIKDKDREELKKLVYMHAESHTGGKELPAELKEQIEKAIKD
jgi:predicted small metal-binding protein